MTKQTAWLGTAVMTTLLALALMWQFRLALVYVLISLALVAAVRPLFQRQAGRGLPLRLTFILLYLTILSGFSLLLVYAIGAAFDDIQQLAEQVSVQDGWRQPAWLLGSSLQQLLDTWLPPPSELFAALIGDQGELALLAVLGFTQGIINLVSGGLIVLFLSIYLSVDQNRFERLWLSLLPPNQRAQARDIWQTVARDLGGYIRSEAVQSLLAALLLGLGYWVLGSPYPALLALTGALALLIPLVGVLLAVILPLLLGLLTGVQISLFTVLYTLVVIAALKLWIAPRLFKRTQYNPILTIVILMALADAYGLLGIIVAPPLSAACQILWGRLVSRRTVSGAAAQIADLKQRQAQIQTIIETMDEPPSLITSSLERLADLLEKAEPTLANDRTYL
jgi:putative permease